MLALHCLPRHLLHCLSKVAISLRPWTIDPLAQIILLSRLSCYNPDFLETALAALKTYFRTQTSERSIPDSPNPTIGGRLHICSLLIQLASNFPTITFFSFLSSSIWIFSVCLLFSSKYEGKGVLLWSAQQWFPLFFYYYSVHEWPYVVFPAKIIPPCLPDCFFPLLKWYIPSAFFSRSCFPRLTNTYTSRLSFLSLSP